MKTNYLVASLYLAPALAAPVLQTATVLVAGASAKAVVIRPGHQATVEETKQVAFDGTSLSPSSSTTKTEEAPASSILDADRPLTTKELMALSQAAHSAQQTSSLQNAPAGSKGIKISVGTLVVPGGAGARRPGSSVVAQLLDPNAGRPYLISGYYIPAQRPDVWVAGMIISFVLVVMGLELWGLMRERYVNNSTTCAASTCFLANDLARADFLARVHSLRRNWRREGSIKLEDRAADAERAVVEEEDEDDSDDEDDMAPFGGYKYPARAGNLRLPEKVDEKAGWI